MNKERPREAGIAAGREGLRQTAEYVRNQLSFAIETTLSGKWRDFAVSAALEGSFFTRLFYVYLDNPERSIPRVRERVAQGEHDVPDEDVRRRYGRSQTQRWSVAPESPCGVSARAMRFSLTTRWSPPVPCNESETHPHVALRYTTKLVLDLVGFY